MTKTLRLRGTCVRCGQQAEVTFYMSSKTESWPDHKHLLCTPCGLPTLHVRFPLEDD